MNYDEIQEAINNKNIDSEIEYRKVHFIKLLYIYFLGGSEEFSISRALAEIEENNRIIRKTKIMTNLQCPYDWSCGFFFKANPQQQKLIEQKLSFCMIDCPHCGSSFRYDAKSQTAHATKSNPIGLKPKNQIVEIDLKAILPSQYYQFLLEKELIEIGVFEDQSNFNLYNLTQLSELASIDDKTYPTIFQMQGFVVTLRNVLGENFKLSEDCSFEKMSKFLCIGEENTRLLLLDDRDKNTLWVFHQDGGDIEKIDNKLTNFVHHV